MSAHTQRYLYEAGLSEMSLKAALDQDDEAGLDVEKKKRIKGKLPVGEYKILGFKKLVGPHGEPRYQSCQNCDKNIVYVTTLQGPGDEVEVGPDCAIALSTGETQAAIEKYVGDEKKKLKFVANSLIAIQKAVDVYATSENMNFLNAYADAIKLSSLGDVMYSIAKDKRTGPFLASYQKTLPEASLKLLKQVAVGLAYEILLSSHAESVKAAITSAFEANKTLKDKAYFFEYTRDGSDFLAEYDLFNLIKQEKTQKGFNLF